jgi:2-haloacid dehalogenase
MTTIIKALVFDAYGTLFDPLSVASLCDELYPGHGSALSQLWRSRQLEYTWLRSLMGSYEDFWKVTEAALVFASRTLGLSCESGPRERLMRAYLSLKPFPEVPEALMVLRGYPLGILSNGTREMLRAVVKNSGLEDVFSQVISVEEARIYKPSPRVYEMAARKMGAEPGAIGFVSSNYWDAAGAKALGFFTCWVNRTNAQSEELGFVPDATGHSLTELAQMLR